MLFRTCLTLLLVALWVAALVPGNLAGPVLAPVMQTLVVWKLEADGQYWLTDKYEHWVKVTKEQWEATRAHHVLHGRPRDERVRDGR